MESHTRKAMVWRIGLVAAIVALLLAGAWQYRSKGLSSDATPAQVAGLHVNPERLDFGEVWEDNHFAWGLPLENHSDSDITIERFYNSCICTEIDPRSLVVPAGQSRDVRLTIDLMNTKMAGEHAGEPVRDFALEVAAIVKGRDEGLTNREWVVRGRVKTAIHFEQSAVDFGRHSDQEQPLPAQRVLVRSLTALDSLGVSGNPPEFSVRALPRPNDSSRFDLEIIPPASLPVGNCKFDLSVTPVQPGGTRLPSKKLPVLAWVVPDVQASSPEILLGAVPVGESPEATFALYSLTGRAFAVEGWHCADNRVAVEREADRGGAPTFRVQWRRVSRPGQQEAEVVFRTVSGSKASSLKIPVKCFGIRGPDSKAP